MSTTSDRQSADTDAFPTQSDASRAFGLRAVDEQLLRVALGPPEATAATWASLRARFPVESLDDGRFYPLRPLVAAALVDAGVEDSELGRMRGVRRLTFVQQQLLFADLAAALELVEAAGARSLLLGGVPLALEHHPDASLRPTRAAELFVDVDAVPAIAAALDAAGWSGGARPAIDLTRRLSELRFSSPGERSDLVLSWRLAPWLTAVHGDGTAAGISAGDPELWAGARPLSVEGRDAPAAGPDDLLLHVITRAYRIGWANEPRWIADLVLLVRSAGATLDWDRFLRRVQRGGLVLPVRDALTYVSSLVDLPVPATVVDALRASTAGDGATRRYAAGNRLMSDRRRRIPGHNLAVDWHRQTFNLGADERARRLTPFVIGRTGAEHLWSVPSVVARRRLGERA